jgi:uncharacterized protein YgiM (DUF1202 family)
MGVFAFSLPVYAVTGLPSAGVDFTLGDNKTSLRDLQIEQIAQMKAQAGLGASGNTGKTYINTKAGAAGPGASGVATGNSGVSGNSSAISNGSAIINSGIVANSAVIGNLSGSDGNAGSLSNNGNSQYYAPSPSASAFVPDAPTAIQTTAPVSILDLLDEELKLAEETIEATSDKTIRAKEREFDAKREEEGFKSLVIARVNDYVNVRSIPDLEGEILGKLYDKSVGSLLSEQDGWYEINSGSVTGWVKAEYCVTGEEAVALAKEVGTRIATVDTITLKVRTEPSTEASVLALVPLADELIVTEELEDWVKVDVEEGEGYLHADFVKLSTEFVSAESREEEAARLEKEAAARRAAQAAAAAAARRAAEREAAKHASAGEPV